MAQQIPLALYNYINGRCCNLPTPTVFLLINPFHNLLIGSGFKLLINE